MVQIADLLAVLKLQDELTPGVMNAISSLQQMDKQAQLTAYKITLLGRGLTEAGVIASAVFTVPILGALDATIKFGSEFETQMTRVITLAGATREQVTEMKGAVLQLAKDTAVAPAELAKGMYVLMSTSMGSEAAMESLGVAAQMTALGMGNMHDTTLAITGAMFAYKDQNLTAADAANVLIKAVQLGNMEIQDLIPSIARVNPVAASMGVSFRDVAAGIATFTHAGVDSAVAATGMRAMLSNILTDSAKTEKGFKELSNALGDSSISMANFREQMKPVEQGGKGLTGAMVELMEKVTSAGQAGVDAANKIFPNIRALTEALFTYKINGGMVVNMLEDMNDGQDELAKGTAELQKTWKFQWDQMLVSVNLLWIKLSDSLLPIFKDVVSVMKEAIPVFSGAIEIFNDLPRALQLTVLGFLAITAAIGPALIAAGQLIQAYGNISRALATTELAMTPLLAVAGALTAALVLLGVTVYEVHQKTGNWLDTLLILATPFGSLLALLDSLAQKLGFNTQLFHDIAAIIRDVVIIGWRELTKEIANFAASTMVFLEKVGNYIKEFFTNVLGTIVKINPLLAVVVAETIGAISKLPGAMDSAGDAVSRIREVTDKLVNSQTQAAYSARDLVDGAMGVAGQMGKTTTTVIANAVAHQSLLDKVAALSEAQKSAIIAGRDHGLTAKQILAEMERLGIGMGVTTDIIGVYERQTSKATAATKQHTTQLEKANDAYEKARDHLKVLNGLQDDFFKTLNNNTQGQDNYIEKILGADTNKTMNDLDRAVKTLTQSGLLVGEAFNRAAKEAGDLARKGIELTPQLYALAAAAGELGPGVNKSGLEWDKLGTKIDINVKEQIKYFNTLQDKSNTYGKTISILASEFSKLGQISNDALEEIMKDFGALFVQLEAANKLTQQKGGSDKNTGEAKIGGNWGAFSVLFGDSDIVSGAQRFSAAVASAANIVNGAMNVWQNALHSGTTATAVFTSAMSGMQAGAIFGPWGAAIGGAAGALTGWIASMTVGRRTVKEFAESMGGFDELHKKLLETLGSVGEDFWVQLTQKVGRGDKEGANRVIAAIQDALENSSAALAEAAGFKTIEAFQETAKKAKQVYDYMVESGKYSADQIAQAYKKMSEAAIDAMDDTTRAAYDDAVKVRDEAKKNLDELSGKITSLRDSIAKEAPEEFMGLVEQAERAQLESLEKQKVEAQKNLDEAEQRIKDAVDAAISASAGAMAKAGQDTVDAIRDALDREEFRVHLRVDGLSGDGVQWGGAQADGGDYLVTKPTLFLAGEAGPERATFSGGNSTSHGSDLGGDIVIYHQTVLGSDVIEESVERIGRKKLNNGKWTIGNRQVQQRTA